MIMRLIEFYSEIRFRSRIRRLWGSKKV